MANHFAKFPRRVLGYCMVIDHEKNQLTFSKAKCMTQRGKLVPCYRNITRLRINICVLALGLSQTSGKAHFLTAHVQGYFLIPPSRWWQLTGDHGDSGLRWLEQDPHPKGIWVVGQSPGGEVLPWPPLPETVPINCIFSKSLYQPMWQKVVHSMASILVFL